MIVEGVLIGIFGNAIFSIIQSMSNSIISEKDDELNHRIYESLEEATKDFFEKYGSTYRKPEDTFLARESNLQLIISSLFYGKKIDLINEIDRRGFHDELEVKYEHLKFFVNRLNHTMREDFMLDKILEEKTHFQKNSETHDNVKKILDKVNGLASDKEDTSIKPQESWKITDIKTGQEKPFKEGKRYVQKFPNGMEYNYMIVNNIMFVEIKDPNGRVSYHEVGMDGSAKNNKFPYPISEYRLVIDETEIVTKKVSPLANGFFYEDITLKWNRTIKTLYDAHGKIKNIEANGGWSVNHNSKTISPRDL